MASWIDLWFFEIIRWIVFLIEVYLAKRVYHFAQSKIQFSKRIAQLRLLNSQVPESPSHSQNNQYNTAGNLKSQSRQITTLMILRDAFPSPHGGQWRGIATGTFVASIFAAVFLMMNYLFHPIVNQWVPGFLPLLLPLIVLPLPYLLEMKPLRTLLLLLGVLGLSFFMLFTFGV